MTSAAAHYEQYFRRLEDDVGGPGGSAGEPVSVIGVPDKDVP